MNIIESAHKQATSDYKRSALYPCIRFDALPIGREFMDINGVRFRKVSDKHAQILVDDYDMTAGGYAIFPGSVEVMK